MKFKKKPLVIEAVQWTGKNADEVFKFAEGINVSHVKMGDKAEFLEIEAPEGVLFADKKDWIIKGIKGEFYPCKPDIFEMTYEACE